MNSFFLLVTLGLILTGIAIYYKQQVGTEYEANSTNPGTEKDSDPELPEWPIAYQTYVHSELHSLKMELESKGVETIVEEVSPGIWGEGVSIQHTLRVHPDDAREAFEIIEAFSGEDRTECNNKGS